MLTEKECTKCKTVKPVNEFYKKPTTKDGYRYWCKKCDLDWKHSKNGKKAAAKYSRSAKKRAANKRYVQTDSFKSRHYKMTKALRKQYPKRDKARQAVNRAVRNGRLPRVSTLNCTYPGCDCSAQEYHHYNGYSSQHWLDVIPYCAIHHREVDSINDHPH